MSSTMLVSVEEYLRTTYRPDCDFVEGVLEERNVGNNDHSEMQGRVFAWFLSRRATLRLKAFVEQRIRTGKRRFRIPDVCVLLLPRTREQVFTSAPYICIEILSPDDTLTKLQERFDDYLAMGVANVWVIDPATRRGWRITRAGHFEALDGVLRTSDGLVELPNSDLFLDEE